MVFPSKVLGQVNLTNLGVGLLAVPRSVLNNLVILIGTFIVYYGSFVVGWIHFCVHAWTTFLVHFVLISAAIYRQIQEEIPTNQTTADVPETPFHLDTEAAQDEAVFVVEDTEQADVANEETNPPQEAKKIQAKKTQAKKTTRVKWTEEEIKELNEYFSFFLKAKTVPNKEDCLKAIRKSKAKEGMLHRRYWHTIVKKISNMNHK